MAAGDDDDELDLVRASAGGGTKYRPPVQHKPRSTDPTNVWGFLLAVGKQWGFPAIAACAAAWMLWTVLSWQRTDTKVFVESVQKNTVALEALASEQKVQTQVLQKIDTNLQKHLEEDDKNHHHH